MGSVMAKALLTLLLSILCFSAFSEQVEPAEQALNHGSHHHYPAAAPVSEPPSHAPSRAPTPHHHHHHHHHRHSPAPAPADTPAHAPVHPLKPHSPPSGPAHPPMHSHPQPRTYHFPRKLVAVQGVVYCKSCNYSGVDTLLGAKPVPGATVKLECNNTRYPVEVKTVSDQNGYFLLRAPGTITNYGFHKCKVWLVSAADTACSKITNLHGGLAGSILRPEKKPFVDEKKREYGLFSVGPFAFESKCLR